MSESSPLRYLLTYAALLSLSALTLALAWFSLGALGTALALGIASLKAGLIAVYFMHLLEGRLVSALSLAVALILVGFFIALAALDVATRAGEQAPLPRAAPTSGR